MLFLDCVWPVAVHCLARLCCLPRPCHSPDGRLPTAPRKLRPANRSLLLSSAARSQHSFCVVGAAAIDACYAMDAELPYLKPAWPDFRCLCPFDAVLLCNNDTEAAVAACDEGDCRAAEREAWMDGCHCARCNGTGSRQLSESVSVCSEEKEEETVLHKQGRA